MIRDVPPLAIEIVDPWEKIEIDPAMRRLAEHAAAAADLAVEEWLERAIRRACPSAFRLAPAAIPAVRAPTLAVSQAPPPDIEASPATLLATAQSQQLVQTPAPMAEPSAGFRRAPTIAERLAQQHVVEKVEPEVTTFAPAAAPQVERQSREQAAAVVSPACAGDERDERAPKHRSKLWAMSVVDEDAITPERAVPPPSRTATAHLALIGVGIALAITAGAATAQYLVPGRSHLRPPSWLTSTTSLPAETDSNAAPSDFASLLPAPAIALPLPGAAPQAPPSPTSAAQKIPEAPVTTPATKLEMAKPEAAAKLESTTPETAAAKSVRLAKGKAAPAPAPAQIAAAPAAAGLPDANTAKVEPDDMAPTDPKALAAWLEQRARNGDTIAQYRLGVLYALGQGVQQDYQRAAQLFKTSADAGVAEAQYNIGVMYGEGLGIGHDPVQAVQWYQKAAAQGNANAAFNLGVAYSNGIGVKQSMDQAAQWFRRAASAGIVNAQFNLGLLYERGDGVPVSQVEAYAWYSAAAAHGDQGATQRRDRLASTLAPSTLREAQARTRQIAREIQATGGGNGGGSLATDAAFKKP